ncbi:hypothetical protein VKT23_018433 [Stygiomarasmius scandens]|uniref:Uncharacterized protein n=1 Tax=Marasmiellus scandens TaxID=2682957 RepID=A0ABR1ISM3_9AGAR
MGGFVLYDNNRFVRTLYDNEKFDAELAKRIAANHGAEFAIIEDSRYTFRWHGEVRSGRMSFGSLLDFLIETKLVSLNEDEIMDKSKGDAISKIIVVGQTSWFLIQFFARINEGLLITKLELLALSFAILNFGTYFMWWNKPQRVRYPIKFDISESARSTNSEDGYPDGFCTRQSPSQELHKTGRGESGSDEEVPLQGNVKNKLSDNSSLPSTIWRCMVATASSTHYESGHEDRDLELAQWSIFFSFMALSAYIPFFVDLFVLGPINEQPLWGPCIFGNYIGSSIGLPDAINFMDK